VRRKCLSWKEGITIMVGGDTRKDKSRADDTLSVTVSLLDQEEATDSNIFASRFEFRYSSSSSRCRLKTF
jgi:hypothetical protein